MHYRTIVATSSVISSCDLAPLGCNTSWQLVCSSYCIVHNKAYPKLMFSTLMHVIFRINAWKCRLDIFSGTALVSLRCLSSNEGSDRIDIMNEVQIVNVTVRKALLLGSDFVFKIKSNSFLILWPCKFCFLKLKWIVLGMALSIYRLKKYTTAGCAAVKLFSKLN